MSEDAEEAKFLLRAALVELDNRHEENGDADDDGGWYDMYMKNKSQFEKVKSYVPTQAPSHQPRYNPSS